jgi:general nucleoside transport system permease protein
MKMIFLLMLQTLRIAVPYLFAASGGVLAERAGIVSLTLEGFMLTGAFCSTLGSFYFGNPWVGVLLGLLGGAVFGAVHAIATIRFKADQIVSAVAINLMVVGMTRFFLRLAFDSSSNSPRVAGFGGEGNAGVLATFGNPLVWLGIVVMPVLAWVINRTRFGLRVRAVGEKPEAATTLGVSVDRIRYGAVITSGALAALGGCYLALDQHQFTDQMTAGRGFIALAAVIFGRWMPVRAGIACLLFAFAEALQIQVQGTGVLPSQFVSMIPYVLTLVALAGVVGRAVPPAALGRAEG